MTGLGGIISTLMQIAGLVLFRFQGWVVVVGILGYLIWQNKRRRQWVDESDQVLLMVEVPKENENKELSAEQMFASLHGILRSRRELRREGSLQEHISCELAAVDQKINFYVWCPKHLKDFVEGQIYAQYPQVYIKEGASDYTKRQFKNRLILGTELRLNKNEVLPIKTFESFEVDPLAGITAVLAKLDKDEELWVQMLIRPIDDKWQAKGLRFIESLKGNGQQNILVKFGMELLQLPLYVLGNIFSLGAPPGGGGGDKDKKKKEDKGGDDKDDKKGESTGQKAIIKAVEEKTVKLGYQTKIRLLYLGTDAKTAKHRLQAVVGSFKQFNTINLNGFKVSKYRTAPDYVDEFRARLFTGKGYILNIEELATLYHLPHTNVQTPNMGWISTKTGEPPGNLPAENSAEPTEVSLFGLTNFRGGQLKFGLKRLDRGRHLYIIGQTGTGKSMLLQLLTLSDIYQGQGFAVIDPHGDYAADIMRYIPEDRLQDVVYFNPADRQFPMAFNPLEAVDPGSKHRITSDLVGVLKRMFESWGPRLEHILRFTILALLDYPDATMLDITRMLTDREFRKKVVAEIKDPVVKGFWVNEFASWNDKFASEAVAPVLNKVGAFIANPLIRNVIGQPKSTFNLRQIMDEGKILIVNLTRGVIGEDNAAVLGALMVTKIQLAAMGRADVPMSERRQFYLYVDEFQNFATDSFAVILSEARKYGLNLTVANQYISQMPPEVKDAVFGNVGSLISFRVGADDAAYFSKYLAPVFEAEDLVQLNSRHVYISMSIDGEKSSPFSAITLRMPEPTDDLTARIVELSREKYASKQAEVEEAIRERSGLRPDTPYIEQKANALGELKNPVTAGYQRPQQQRRDGGRRYQRPAAHQRQPQHQERPREQQPNRQESQRDQGRDVQPGETINLRH